MLVVILKSSIPVVTVGLPRFSALCEWKCYLQMEKERTCVYFCVVPHPALPPKRHGPTSSAVVDKTFLNSCVFSSHTLSAIIDRVFMFFPGALFLSRAHGKHDVLYTTSAMKSVPLLLQISWRNEDCRGIKPRRNNAMGSTNSTQAAGNRQKVLILLIPVLHLRDEHLGKQVLFALIQTGNS